MRNERNMKEEGKEHETGKCFSVFFCPEFGFLFCPDVVFFCPACLFFFLSRLSFLFFCPECLFFFVPFVFFLSRRPVAYFVPFVFFFVPLRFFCPATVHVSVVEHSGGPGRSHKVDCHFAPCVGRIGASERCPHQTSRLLGKLGGLSPHDPGETPRTRRGPLVEVGRRRQHFSLGAAREAAFTLTGAMGFTPGVLGRRGFALESAAARICREAGGRVTTNVFVRDLDVAVPNALDGRCLEVADGLPLFGGAQLAVDTTLVSPLHADGSRHAADSDGAVLATARRRQERTYPELVGPESSARLVVLAMETGGRWSDEAMAFVRLLARAKVRSEPRILKKRVEQAWRLRWLSMLGCAAARVLAASLLELRSSGGVDGPTPLSHEVEGDHRYSGLDLS